MPKYVHFIGYKLSICFSLVNQSFYVKNAKIDCFGEKIILSAFLIDLKCWWLQSGLAPNTPAFLLMSDFYAFLKLHF